MFSGFRFDVSTVKRFLSSVQRDGTFYSAIHSIYDPGSPVSSKAIRPGFEAVQEHIRLTCPPTVSCGRSQNDPSHATTWVAPAARLPHRRAGRLAGERLAEPCCVGLLYTVGLLISLGLGDVRPSAISPSD